MSACTAARLGFVEEASIGMSTQDHVTSLIDDAVFWVGGNIIEEEVDCLSSSHCGISLSSCYGTESHKEFVVYCTGIVKKGSNNFLNLVLALLVIKNSRCVTLRSELCFGTIEDG